MSKVTGLTLKQAIESGKPFKLPYWIWWIDPNAIPGWLQDLSSVNYKSNRWELGTKEQLKDQEKGVEKLLRYL